MYIVGFLILISFQVLGTVISAGLLPHIPGPIIGLILLFFACLAYKRVPEGLVTVSKVLVTYIALMLIPSAVLVLKYYSLISDQLLRLAVTIIISQIVSIWFCGRLMQFLVRYLNGEK